MALKKTNVPIEGNPKLHQSKLEYSLNESSKEVEHTSQSSCDNQMNKMTLDGKQYLLGKLTEFDKKAFDQALRMWESVCWNGHCIRMACKFNKKNHRQC